jgi:hypothetical protein
VLTLALVRFPDLLGWRPREPLLTAIANGMAYSWNHRGFRTMLAYFALANVFLAPALVLVSPLVLSFGTGRAGGPGRARRGGRRDHRRGPHGVVGRAATAPAWRACCSATPAWRWAA